MVAFGAILSLYPLYLSLILTHIDRRILACHPTTVTLLDQTRQMCRTKHYSPRTEEAYTRWSERFLRLHREAAGQWIHISIVLLRKSRTPSSIFLVAAARERHVTALSATGERSERYACRLRRSLGAEPVAQQLEIADLSLGAEGSDLYFTYPECYIPTRVCLSGNGQRKPRRRRCLAQALRVARASYLGRSTPNLSRNSSRSGICRAGSSYPL
jgi:hypothetical protein